MTARKKVAKKKVAKKKVVRKKAVRKKLDSRKTAREAFAASMKSFERQLPPGLARRVRELRKNIKTLERQIDKARAEREARWQRLEMQIRKDAAKALRRLERAIEPSKPARRKTTARRTSARKKAARTRKK